MLIATTFYNNHIKTMVARASPDSQ